MFGGGGMNPRKMKQMMEQMGIDVEEIDAEEVVIRTDEEELVFDDAEVTLMNAQGQQTYQVLGDPETRERGAGATGAAEADAEGDAAGSAADAGSEAIPEDDVQIVAQRAGVSEEAAREALAAEEGDLAAAIARLE